MVKTRRIPDNPFRHMQKVNASLDVRHQRRAMTADEFTRLIDAARNGADYRGLHGPDRAALYLTAGATGLRASELGSLTPSSFNLYAETPTVVVEAAYSKHRCRDEVPLHPELVTSLRPWIAGKKAGELLWGGKWATQCSASAMIQRDLKDARAVWLDEAKTPEQRQEREASDFLLYRDHDGEVADFHSTRHSFITNLVTAGVMPKDAITLAPHSTITLTMDRYAHVGIRDTANAVARLTLPNSTTTTDNSSLKMTGTDDTGAADAQHRRSRTRLRTVTIEDW